jgi:SAM-dependent methyltransferase
MAGEAEHEIPAPVAMMGLITGYWVSQAVGAVALLGVADYLDDGPRSSDDLARDVKADPQALFRLLRLLASIGVFVEVAPRSFGLTALGETLRSDAPGSVRNFAITETAPGHWQPWGRLSECIRTGQPTARAALGMEFFEWYAQNPDEAGFFSAAMGNLSAMAAEELVRVYDFSTARKVADVGGAHGVLLSAVLRANPTIRGILFDLPHVIAGAGEIIEAQGLSGRCELQSGDFLEAVPDGADLHLLKQIVHDWDDERATRLLKNCHRALAPRGELFFAGHRTVSAARRCRWRICGRGTDARGDAQIIALIPRSPLQLLIGQFEAAARHGRWKVVCMLDWHRVSSVRGRR